MPELNVLLDSATGAVLVEVPDDLPSTFGRLLAEHLGPGTEVGCARPRTILPPPRVPPGAVPTAPSAPSAPSAPGLRVAGYYHNSLIEGPGRRSCLLVSGCPLACVGCWVPTLHAPDGGVAVPVARLAAALLDPAFERDGVSLLGGEPFAQPDGLWALVQSLRARGCGHLLAYSGYTYEHLRRVAARQPAIGAVLDTIEVLVDGPYVQALAASAGPWTGSGNQRVIDLVATRRRGQVVLLDPDAPFRRASQGGEGSTHRSTHR
jgi:anaerobic ribonucleoside-triphosphate reductase activating protein